MIEVAEVTQHFTLFTRQPIVTVTNMLCHLPEYTDSKITNVLLTGITSMLISHKRSCYMDPLKMLKQQSFVICMNCTIVRITNVLLT